MIHALFNHGQMDAHSAGTSCRRIYEQRFADYTTDVESEWFSQSPCDESFEMQNAIRQANGGGSKKSQYHKTKMCPWHRDGKCFMGTACNYAHSKKELRPKPDLSKTKLCPELIKGRQCTRWSCRFAHDYVELRATSAFFKTRLCKFWQRGHCPAGVECRHAHGRDDLRSEEVLSRLRAVASTIPSVDRYTKICDESMIADVSGLSSTRTDPMAFSSGQWSRTPTTTASKRHLSDFMSLDSTPSAVHTEDYCHQMGPLVSFPLDGSPLSSNGTTEEAWKLIRSWISQEVERQVVTRTTEGFRPGERIPAPPGERIPAPPGERIPATPGERIPATPGERIPAPPDERIPATPGERIPAPPDERIPAPVSSYLPSEVLQGFNSSSSHGIGLYYQDSSLGSSSSPVSFAAAVKSLIQQSSEKCLPISQMPFFESRDERLLLLKKKNDFPPSESTSGENSPTRILLRSLVGLHPGGGPDE